MSAAGRSAADTVGSAAPRHGADVLVPDRPDAIASVRTFHTLDLLRGVAALTVLFFHAAFIYGLRPPAEGQIAVDLFFAMSGFIIAQRYDADFAGGMAWSRFVALRLVRLYPLFLLGLGFGAIPALVAVASGHGTADYRAMLETVPAALVMLPSHALYPSQPTLYPVDVVVWSLALEVAANAVYAAGFRFASERRLAVLCAATAGLLGLCAWRWGTLNVGFEWQHALGGAVRIAFGFSAGLLASRLYRRGRLRLRGPWWLPVVAALLLFWMPALPSQPWSQWLGVVVFVPAVLVLAVGAEPPPRLRAACAVAGTLSYAFYLLHEPAIGVFLRLETRVGADAAHPAAGAALLFTGALLAVCAAAHTLYDRPVRQRLLRLLAPTPRAPRCVEAVKN